MSVPVLYNQCYGGFSFSTAAVKLYNELGAASGAPSLSSESMARDISRTDRVMAAVVDQLGTAANGLCAEIGVAWVDERFEDYVEISEYDGSESVVIDFMGYKLRQIQNVVECDEQDEYKIAKIKDILAEAEPEVKI